MIPVATIQEKSVLSCIVNNPEMFWEAPNLCAAHFYGPNREIFEWIAAEVQNGKREENECLNLNAIISAAHNAGRLDAIGGPAEIVALLSFEPFRGSFARNVETLCEFRARRLAVAASHRLLAAATEEDAQSLSEALQTPITAISDALTDSAPPISLRDIVKSSIERFMRRTRGDESSHGIATLPLLDDYLKGAHPGRMWIIGAYPEGGKSVMASQIILDAALRGVPSLFLSLEMPERDIMDRMIVQASRIDAEAFTEPCSYAMRETGEKTLSAYLIGRVGETIGTIGKSPLRVQRPANRNLQTVIASIRKAHREMGIKIAAVDYVQLIRGGKHDSKEAEVSEISHALQECAGDMGITLLVLSQLNADGDTKHGRVIEEDADAVLNIVQDRDKESETYKVHKHILIAKDRHHGSGGTKVKLILDRKLIRFVEGEDMTAKKKKANFTR